MPNCNMCGIVIDGDGPQCLQCDYADRVVEINKLNLQIETLKKHSEDVGKINQVRWDDYVKATNRADVAERLINEVLVGVELLEHTCPCGARPESLHTHPHVTNCLVESILNKLRSKSLKRNHETVDEPCPHCNYNRHKGRVCLKCGKV